MPNVYVIKYQNIAPNKVINREWKEEMTAQYHNLHDKALCYIDFMPVTHVHFKLLLIYYFKVNLLLICIYTVVLFAQQLYSDPR